MWCQDGSYRPEKFLFPAVCTLYLRSDEIFVTCLIHSLHRQQRVSMDHFDRSALLQFHQQVELSGRKQQGG